MSWKEIILHDFSLNEEKTTYLLGSGAYKLKWSSFSLNQWLHSEYGCTTIECKDWYSYFPFFSCFMGSDSLLVPQGSCHCFFCLRMLSGFGGICFLKWLIFIIGDILELLSQILLFRSEVSCQHLLISILNMLVSHEFIGWFVDYHWSAILLENLA